MKQSVEVLKAFKKDQIPQKEPFVKSGFARHWIDYHPIYLIALGDALWQACVQLADPAVDNRFPTMGDDFLSVDFLAIMYPIVIGLMVSGLAVKPLRMKAERAALEADSSTKRETIAPDSDTYLEGPKITLPPDAKTTKSTPPISLLPAADLGMIMCLGIYGWTAGYYLAHSGKLGVVEKNWTPEVENIEDWGSMLAVGAIVGAMSALVLTAYMFAKGRPMHHFGGNLGLADQPEYSPKQWGLRLASNFVFTFGAGMLWYLSYCLPHLDMGSHVGGDEHAWNQAARALFAPLFTGLGTGGMLYADKRVTDHIKKNYR